MEFIGANNNKILNEVYFGETDDIKELLEIIHDFRAPYIKKKTFSYVFAGSNTDKNLLKMSNKLEEMFGFGAVDFNIINKNFMNAFTYPVCYNYGIGDPEKHIHSNSKGFYFDKELNYVTSISYTSNIILNSDFTDREILAVILHEIGHSFVVLQTEMAPLVASRRDMSVIQTILLAIVQLCSFNIPAAVQTMMSILTNRNDYKHFKITIDRMIKKSPIGRLNDIVGSSFTRINVILGKGVDTLSKIFGLHNISKAFDLFISGWSFLNDKQKKDYVKNVHKNTALDRSMEYFSDNFAASYGLGKELSTCLEKMGFGDGDKSKFGKAVDLISKANPINLLLGELVKVPHYELINNIDVHPMHANRVNKIEQDLKKELAKNNINPKMKKEIEATLKEMKEMKDSFKKAAKIKEANPEAYKRVWMAAMMDEQKFTNDEEEKMTSMKDRDQQFDKMFKENAGLFNLPEDYYDLYEFM
ncbi:MAG: hypothetical protein PHC62_00030 [Candidatus Izemoplasmatales bacterium]|nr:hypothetical protein [Candidatus Izemoplasmatales bacterium]